MPKDAMTDLAAALAADPALAALGARLESAEPGYVEILAEAGAASAGALALLAEAAARLAALSDHPDPETAELSLHLHGAPGAGARLLARGELLRPARADRPLITAQADVFRVAESGEEALAASALVALLAR